METSVVERVLRALPGVLDCSVDDEGIAVVVHPEIDPRLLEMRAQMALGEIGERRPLLVVGGMSTTGAAAEPLGPGSQPRRSRSRSHSGGGRSPVSVLGFAVLVVALITVLPISRGNGRTGGLPTALPPVAVVPSASGSGPLPIFDEPAAAVVAAAGGLAAAAEPVRAGTVRSGRAVPTVRSVPPAPTTAVAVVAAPRSSHGPPAVRKVSSSGKAVPGRGKAVAKGKGAGKGTGGVQAAGAFLRGRR